MEWRREGKPKNIISAWGWEGGGSFEKDLEAAEKKEFTEKISKKRVGPPYVGKSHIVDGKSAAAYPPFPEMGRGRKDGV